MNKPVHLTGIITRMDWTNPHAWIHLDVNNPDGTVTNWAIQAGTPNTLHRKGFSKSSLGSGSRITVDAYQAKDGTHRASGVDVVLPDGQKLMLESGTGHRGL